MDLSDAETFVLTSVGDVVGSAGSAEFADLFEETDCHSIVETDRGYLLDYSQQFETVENSVSAGFD